MIINADGRFKLLEKPMAYPFHDIVNRTPDGPVFDLDVDVDDFAGVVYITADHVEEMAKLLGMIHGEEVEHLHDKIKELEAQKNRLPEGVEELVNGIDELVTNYHNRAVSGNVGDELFDISLLVDSGAEESGEPESKSSNFNGQSSSASKRKGTNELSSNSSDEFGFNL